MSAVAADPTGSDIRVNAFDLERAAHRRPVRLRPSRAVIEKDPVRPHSTEGSSGGAPILTGGNPR
jgi:hypothetical protein